MITADNKVKGDHFSIMVEKVIRQHLHEDCFNVQVLAELMHISRASLHRKLRNERGQSTSEFIRNLRLEKAARLIKSSNILVSEAARQSGFHNMSYFSKCFREKYHCIPSRYISCHDNP